MDVDGIKRGLVQGFTDIDVGEGALGCSGDIVPLGSTLGMRANTVDERRVMRRRATLNVKINTKL